MKNSLPTFTAKRKPDTIPAAISAEMQRLAKIHPLLSPTLGWPKVKGVKSVEAKLNLTNLAKVDAGMMNLHPVWGLAENAEMRQEANQAFRGLLETVHQLATGALKPAGWKLETVGRHDSHHLAMLWTRKNREVAILAYLRESAPNPTWFNTSMSRTPRMRGFNAYSTDARLVIATSKGDTESLRDVCAALDAHMRTQRRKQWHGAPFEFFSHHHGMSQVHICKMGKDDVLPPQHRKLVESLRGQVCFVGFKKRLGEGAVDTPAQILDAMPGFTLGGEQAWSDMSSILSAGHVRLVAVNDQGRMKWCETFGPDETVPRATIKRLLSDSRSHTWAPQIEQRAIYKSLGAR